MTKFAAIYDVHYGFERKNGHKVSLHDLKAFNTAIDFLADFRPEILILGGDILDCGVISHHNHGKPGRTEGLRLLADAKGCQEEIIEPCKRLKAKKNIYIKGNHEAWLDDLTDYEPGLAGLVDIQELLGLKNWEIISQGGHFNLGRLTFVHGDQFSGEFAAKSAVVAYERNMRFGHFHSHSVYSKNTPLHDEYPKTGVGIPCLCRKNPSYGKGKPNRWSQGFLYGYLLPDGSFHDYVVTIIRGKCVIGGKVYG
jgi:metallophosphoesterase superfamily enzyme